MRVLMVSKACLVGAYQRKLEELARCGVELTVVVPPSWRDPGGELRLERTYTAGYSLIVEPIRFNGSYHLHYYPGLARRLAAVHPAIVHIDEEPYNFATWHALRLARGVGARTLFFSWQNLLRSYPPPFSWFERYVLSHVDTAIVGNQAAGKVWRQKGYRGPMRVIPQFGVDPELYQPVPGRKLPGGFRIGYLGRIFAGKGVDLLVQTVAGLPGMWRLDIVGSGPDLPSLRQLVVQLGIADRVTFEAAIPSMRVPAFLQGLDVLVLPSRSQPNWVEQFGRVLIEAMSCGIAVVGSNSGEIPQVIGDAGLIFPEADQQALRSHLLRLQTDPDLRLALGQQGRARVLQRYTQARIAAQTFEVYQTLVDNNSESW